MKKIQDFFVDHYTWLNKTNYVIHLKSTQNLPGIFPGNFAEIEISDSSDIFLRRPLSIFDIDYDKNQISFYVKIIGKGTRKLSTLQHGRKVNIIYPLGNSFSLTDSGNVLIAGGGSGIAPFLLLAEELKRNSTKMTFIFGAHTKDDIFFIERFSDYGPVHISTEDGSMGEKGLITDHHIFNSDDIGTFDKIFTCGPDPMMKAIAKIAKKQQITCEVSLENMMACGFGACLCCVVESVNGNVCVCTEGPVFDSKKLSW